jgi:hypothetical protein
MPHACAFFLFFFLLLCDVGSSSGACGSSAVPRGTYVASGNLLPTNRDERACACKRRNGTEGRIVEPVSLSPAGGAIYLWDREIPSGHARMVFPCEN